MRKDKQRDIEVMFVWCVIEGGGVSCAGNRGNLG